MVRGCLPRAFTGVLLACSVALTAGCGSGQPAAFHPAGGTPAGNISPTSTAHADGLTWPPFGPNAHIVMPGWLPAARSEVPAVITAKNFLLAFLYSEYKGGQDQRWDSYVSGSALSG